MDEQRGPLLALITDAVQHLEQAEQTSTSSAETAGSHLARAAVQAQQVTMLVGTLLEPR
jgi:hypothetical protein